MNQIDRTTKALGGFLIGLGVIFLVLNVVGLDTRQTWPVIFYLLAAGFFAPAFIFPEHRRGLAGLFIPGGIMLALALIFTYNVLAKDFGIWAYAWLLIPAGVGLGLLAGDLFGGWGDGSRSAGLWLLGANTGLFALFATIFGRNEFISIAGPALIMLAGILILVKVFRR